MLPLYAACCNSFVIHDHPEYDARGWTRVERMIFASFNMPVFDVLEPMPGTLNLNYTSQAGRKETRVLLADATAGLLTNPSADGPLIQQLQELCFEEWGHSWRGKWSRDYYQHDQKIRGVQRLELGNTEVRLWDATPGSSAW